MRAGRKDEASRRRGAAMVEFSLTFVAFILALMALAEMGRAVWIFSTLRHAAFEGARFATVHGSENPVIENGQDQTLTAIEEVVKRNAVGLESKEIQIQTSYSPNNDPGGEFTLTAAYSMPTIFGRLFFSGSRLDISTQAAGVVLQ